MLDAFYQSLVCFFVPYLVKETFKCSFFDYMCLNEASAIVHPLCCPTLSYLLSA